MSNTLKQMTKSFFLGGISAIADYIIFSLCYYVFFNSFTNVPFLFGPLNYSELDGGLCMFLSTAISYLLSQVVNYFVQKKYAFNFDGSSKKRFFGYLFSSCIVYLIILYIPGIVSAPINTLLGFTLGPIVTKCLVNFVGFLIQFPINKFLIFK